MPHPPVVLVVAGWDPSGAAGLAQDLKVLASLGVHACGAPAALTVQGQGGVAQVQGVDPALLLQQLQTLLKKQPVAAVKLGLLYSAAQVDVVAEALAMKPGLPMVIDPVLGASSGGALTLPDLIPAMKARLFPHCSVLTPNLEEAAALTGLPKALRRAEMPKQAYALLKLGVKAVLLKGGHLDGEASPDFYLDGNQEAWLEAPRIETKNSRGTGCALASAIAAELAMGAAPLEACRAAKVFLTVALQESAKHQWEHGSGPIQFG
jgi:hydroxymethylpyrimidine/phosphomethylpyrimidine kinase